MFRVRRSTPCLAEPGDVAVYATRLAGTRNFEGAGSFRSGGVNSLAQLTLTGNKNFRFLREVDVPTRRLVADVGGRDSHLPWFVRSGAQCNGYLHVMEVVFHINCSSRANEARRL